MDWASEDDRAEWAIDAAAAGVFAAAVAFALWAMAAAAGPTIAVGAVPAFLLAYAILRRLPAAELSYALPVFELAPIEPLQEAEGELTGELLLDDMLKCVEPGARVVRLFDPRQSRGGELQASVIRRCRSSHSSSAPADASQALSDALAELRRSLH